MDRVARRKPTQPLADIIARFKVEFPAEWEACRRWPTESGLQHIMEHMKA